MNLYSSLNYKRKAKKEAAARRRAEIHSRTHKLLFETWNIESVRIETRQIASLEKREYLLRAVIECRTVFHYLIRYAVYFSSFGRNWNRRIEKPCLRLLASIRKEFDGGKFDYPVPARHRSCRFNIEHDQGSIQLQHFIPFSQTGILPSPVSDALQEVMADDCAHGVAIECVSCAVGDHRSGETVFAKQR